MELTQFTDIGLYILRLVVGLVFIYHAVPKLKNPKGIARMMGKEKMMPMVVILGAVELISAFGLILGILVVLYAKLLSLIMLGAIMMKITKWHFPFSATDKTGWEFELVLLAANIAILTTGGGSIALL